MKRTRWLSLLLALSLLAGLLAGCGNTDDSAPDGTSGATGGAAIRDENDVSLIETDDAAPACIFVGQTGDTYVFRTTDGEDVAFTFACTEGTAGTVTVSGTTLTLSGLTGDVVYTLSGRLYGNLVVEGSADGKAELSLCGVTVRAADACPLRITGCGKATLSAKKGTENYLFDMRAAADTYASAVYADCDLSLQGKGALYVYAAKNNGVHTKDDLTVKNLTLQVECADNALKGNDGITVESGALVLIARQGDGLKTTSTDLSSKGKQRGNVTLAGGDLLIYAACDGIDAACDVIIGSADGGPTLQIFTARYAKYTQATADSAAETAAAGVTPTAAGRGPGGTGGMGGPGGGAGGMGGPGGGMAEGNPDKSDQSTKGIKAGNTLTVAGGSVTVAAYDDALHANAGTALENGETSVGNVTVSGGSLTLSSNDDGIHGDGDVLVSGGRVTVASSYEGIEGARVTIAGGYVSVTATDDGLNGTATDGAGITLSGGTLYILAGGDGLDSNSRTAYGGIVIRGGRAVIFSTGGGDSAIDTEAGYCYTGGLVVAIGQAGGMSGESTHCSLDLSTVGITAAVRLTAGQYLSLSGVCEVTLPVGLNASVVCLGSTTAAVSTVGALSGTPDENGIVWF